MEPHWTFAGSRVGGRRIFLLIAATILALMYGYVGWRLIVPAPFGLPITISLWVLLIVLYILPFVLITLQFKGKQGDWLDPLAWFTYLSFGFITLVFAFVAARDLVFLAAYLSSQAYQLISNWLSASPSAADVVDPERRKLLINTVNLGVLATAASLAGYGYFEATREPRVIEVDVPIDDLPSDLHGFRIVQISDIHVSHTIKRAFVQRVVDRVTTLRGDVIALTGDLVDGSVDDLGDDTAPLADLDAPHGKYFITGNHEYYSGVEPWIAQVKKLGFRVLMNENELIERGTGRLLLAGVTDYSGGHYSPAHKSDPFKAMAAAPSSHFSILLAHQPKSIFDAEKAGFDYVMSGHTHGGQYFPYHFLVSLFQPYVAGMHRHGRARIYVSRGTGYWGPQLRIGAPSEITVHRLITA